MSERILQRVVFPVERNLRGLYYRFARSANAPHADPGPTDRFSIPIGRGSMLITDTYFNNFYECYWRRYTRIGAVRLRLELSGRGTVMLLRRSVAAGLAVLDQVEFDGERVEVSLEVPEPRLHFREAGALHFDVVARSSGVTLHRGEWLGEDPRPESEPVRLAAGYCTFNRVPFLLNNVRVLMDDPDVADVLARVIVVDQGTSRVRDHVDFPAVARAAGSKLQVVEQDNFGGAGGFTRSILEARGVPGASHMLLMDDDAVTEPESVFRAAAFLATAREDLAVGGPMLDLLRPLELYEAGSWVEPATLSVGTPLHRSSVEPPENLEPFLEVEHTHYNAWWFFAFPLRLVDRLGLPMPMFIRGDDVEFGCRLHRAGVSTTTVPGLGIWHEPFYLKQGGWQTYYDLRNMLTVAALHFPIARRWAVGTFLRRLAKLLLSYRYFEVALLCEASDDFLRGPEVLESDPRATHRRILAIRQAYPQEAVPRERCLPILEAAEPPVGRIRRLARLARCLLHQALHPSPRADAQPGVVRPETDLHWWCVGRADVVAIEDWHAEHHRLYRRSRPTTFRLLLRGLGSAWRLHRGHDRAGESWRAAHPRLTSEAFWNDYLGLRPSVLSHPGPADRGRSAA